MAQQSVSQIRADIAHTRDNISQTVNELEERFQELKDVRGSVQRYPLPSVLVSFGIGFLLSGAFNAPMIRQVRGFATKTITASLTGVLIQQAQQRFGLGAAGPGRRARV